ncbi:MAG: hypothetical protein KF833_04745 [Verrucomicrobiae bacterium]|nr:hypothetical protein [Verrucomicrobiae bacterium]
MSDTIIDCGWMAFRMAFRMALIHRKETRCRNGCLREPWRKGWESNPR